MRLFLRRTFLAVAVVTISACGGHAAAGDGGVGSVIPAVLQGGGQPPTFTRFNPNTYSGLYGGIVSGPDGNMWFLDQGGPGLAKITMTGAVTEVPLPNDTSLSPQMIAVGPHKTFFVLSTCFNGSTGGAVEFVTMAGVAKSFSLPSDGCYGGIAAGRDGDAWITGPTNIYRVSPSGVIQSFPYPEGTQINEGSIVSGPGGRLWFADNTSFSLGSIDPTTGTINEYPYGQSCFMSALSAPPDGNLWFGCSPGDFSTSDIIRMTPAGVATVYPISNPFIVPAFATIGPGGWPYLTVFSNQGTPPGLLRVNTTSGLSKFIAAPYGLDNFAGDATGPDGNIWISATSGVYTGHIDVYILNVLGVSPTSLNFAAPQLTATLSAHETKKPTLEASSSNVGIATVTPGQNFNTFVVTSVGVGNCTITIQDSKGNSFDVPVTVQ